MNRKLFIHKCYFLLWLNECYVYLKQKFGIGFYTTAQEKREQSRMIKQTVHYNKYIIKAGGRYRSIVLAGRRY